VYAANSSSHSDSKTFFCCHVGLLVDTHLHGWQNNTIWRVGR